MALNDVFQLTDLQRLPSGETILNTYFYERIDPAGSAQDLVGAWIADTRPAILGVQSSALVHYLTRAISLGDVADFYELGEAGIVGLRSGPVRNEWDCFAYTLRPSTRAVRPGSKRIGGVPEGDAEYTNGVVTDSSMLILLQACRTALAAGPTGVDSDYQPVIVKRVLDGGSYRLPETDGELVAVPVSTVLLNTKISHQVSRGNQR